MIIRKIKKILVANLLIPINILFIANNHVVNENYAKWYIFLFYLNARSPSQYEYVFKHVIYRWAPQNIFHYSLRMIIHTNPKSFCFDLLYITEYVGLTLPANQMFVTQTDPRGIFYELQMKLYYGMIPTWNRQLSTPRYVFI